MKNAKKEQGERIGFSSLRPQRPSDMGDRSSPPKRPNFHWPLLSVVFVPLVAQGEAASQPLALARVRP